MRVPENNFNNCKITAALVEIYCTCDQFVRVLCIESIYSIAFFTQVHGALHFVHIYVQHIYGNGIG